MSGLFKQIDSSSRATNTMVTDAFVEEQVVNQLKKLLDILEHMSNTTGRSNAVVALRLIEAAINTVETISHRQEETIRTGFKYDLK